MARTITLERNGDAPPGSGLRVVLRYEQGAAVEIESLAAFEDALARQENRLRRSLRGCDGTRVDQQDHRGDDRHTHALQPIVQAPLRNHGCFTSTSREATVQRFT